MEFKELVQKRYAARQYEDKKIDEETISKLLDQKQITSCSDLLIFCANTDTR